MIEGGSLVLLCSVAKGTGNITFSWHREATRASVGRKTQRSLSAELEVPAVQEGDAGRYYCRADNGHDPVQSRLLSVRVRSELHSESAQTETPDQGRGTRSHMPGVSGNRRLVHPCKLDSSILLSVRENMKGLDRLRKRLIMTRDRVFRQ